MAKVITVPELASYLRDESVTETTAGLLVSLANDLVSEALGETVAADPPTRARAITFEVAARAFRNPNGYSSETIDDYTYRRDAETRQAGVYLTGAERMELQGLTAGAPVLYTLDLGTPAPWA